MKIDNLLLTGLTMIVGGVIWFFGLISHPKGSKSYCIESECTYLGAMFFIIGSLIVGYKIYKWQKEKKE